MKSIGKLFGNCIQNIISGRTQGKQHLSYQEMVEHLKQGRTITFVSRKNELDIKMDFLLIYNTNVEVTKLSKNTYNLKLK